MLPQWYRREGLEQRIRCYANCGGRYGSRVYVCPYDAVGLPNAGRKVVQLAERKMSELLFEESER